MKHLKKIILISLLAFFLQGCTVALIGGAAAATTLFVFHDHRSSMAKQADEKLEATIRNKLNAEPVFKKKSHIIVSAFQGTVLLAGQTPIKELKRQAERITLTTPGIVRLYNEINIEAPNSNLSRLSDDWINTKVKMDLGRAKSLKTAQVKVITENGIVYLTGKANSAQQQTITNIVRKISGVEKVVKVFN